MPQEPLLNPAPLSEETEKSDAMNSNINEKCVYRVDTLAPHVYTHISTYILCGVLYIQKRFLERYVSGLNNGQ